MENWNDNFSSWDTNSTGEKNVVPGQVRQQVHERLHKSSNCWRFLNLDFQFLHMLFDCHLPVFEFEKKTTTLPKYFFCISISNAGVHNENYPSGSLVTHYLQLDNQPQITLASVRYKNVGFIRRRFSSR